MFFTRQKTYSLAHAGDKKPLEYYVNKVNRQEYYNIAIKPHKDSVKALKSSSKYQSVNTWQAGHVAGKTVPILACWGIPPSPLKLQKQLS